MAIGENALSLQRAGNTRALGNWRRYNLQELKPSSWRPRPRQAEATLSLSSLFSSLRCFMSLQGLVPDSQPLTRNRPVSGKTVPKALYLVPWPSSPSRPELYIPRPRSGGLGPGSKSQLYCFLTVCPQTRSLPPLSLSFPIWKWEGSHLLGQFRNSRYSFGNEIAVWSGCCFN